MARGRGKIKCLASTAATCATMPPKKFLAVAHPCQALYPSKADVASVQAPFRPNKSVGFDEFSFTVVVTYNDAITGLVPRQPSNTYDLLGTPTRYE